MSARSLATAALAAALAWMCVPASAFAGSGDEVAATRYLRAARSDLEELKRLLPAARQDADAYVTAARAQCPDVAAQAPGGSELDELGEASFFAVALAAERAGRSPTLAFARRISRLRWSSRRVTALVRRFAASQRAEASLQPPAICPALRAWAASGYRTVPPGTAAFVRTATAQTVSNEQILQQLRPYARGHARSLLRAVARLEGEVGLAFLKAVLQASAILDEGLGLRPAPPAPGG